MFKRTCVCCSTAFPGAGGRGTDTSLPTEVASSSQASITTVRSAMLKSSYSCHETCRHNPTMRQKSGTTDLTAMLQAALKRSTVGKCALTMLHRDSLALSSSQETTLSRTSSSSSNKGPLLETASWPLPMICPSARPNACQKCRKCTLPLPSSFSHLRNSGCPRLVTWNTSLTRSSRLVTSLQGPCRCQNSLAPSQQHGTSLT
mmetsp:Transcript_11705/g.27271  ORF Transcript_11705/g.27271 Transcript_11705/m.27271 type:complete len:203 (-) Transcript_11705:409-1017(-)